MKRIILYSSGFFLLLTALLKVMALLANDEYLQNTDKLLGVKNIYILWVIMLCELFTVWLILIKPWERLTFICIFLLGTGFIIYRVTSKLGGFAATCPCIGNMGKALGLSPQTEGFILSFIATWLFISGALLLWYKPFRLNVKH